MISILEYCEDDNNTPPPELKMAWRVSRFGDPYGKGWMEWQAGIAPKMAIADNIYKAYTAYQNVKGGERAKWVDNNKHIWSLISKVKKIRREIERGKSK